MPRLSLPASPRTKQPWLLALCLAAGGIASVLARQDANWDLANYHLYNPWAWLTGRYGYDLAPAQLQTFHNPLLDVPFYAMVAADWPPRAIAFVMGLPAGVAAYFTLKLAQLLFANVAPPLAGAATAVAALIGLTGANGRSMLGSTMNEWHVAAFVAAALWLVVADRVAGRDRPAVVAAAGFLVGMACGLKLTAAVYAIGIAAALLARRDLRAGVRDGLVFGVAVLAGIALTLGPWMAWLHADTGNPLFPYFNDVFRSPLLPPKSFLDPRFGPKSAMQWLELPFALWHPLQYYVAERTFRDARFPMLMALSLAALAATVVSRIRRRPAAVPVDAGTLSALRFLAGFVAVSFVVWAILYSIYRYLLAAELVTGILIVALVLRLTPPPARLGALVAVAALVVATTDPPKWDRISYGPRFLDVTVPQVAPGALVVLTDGAPMAHVLLRFPGNARHVGLDSNLVRPDEATSIRARAAAIVDAHPGPIYELAPAGVPTERTLAAYGLARRTEGCAQVRSNIVREPLRLCPVERRPR